MRSTRAKESTKSQPVVSIAMPLGVRRPRPDKVWERGSRVDVVLERTQDIDRDRTIECEVALVGASAWLRSGRTTLVGACAFEDDADEVRLTWTVPEDVPTGEYELRAHVPNAKPAIEASTRVMVAERVAVVRTSAGEARARWDRRAVPKDYSMEDGWKLAIDIVPEVRDGEDVNAVVSQAFILAAESGLRTHTRDGTRILCDISTAERDSQSKSLRLLPNRVCEIGICAFGDDSEVMQDYVTSRVRVDMSHTKFQVIAGGHPSPSGRCIRAAEGYYVRTPPPKTVLETKQGGQELKDMTNIDETDTFTKEVVTLGQWGTVEGADGWRQESGLNVLVVRADDFQPIYDRTWDMSGGARRARALEEALQSFMKAFFDGGEVDIARKSVPEHFLCITSCGQWSGGAPKVSEKVGKVLQLVLVGILGADQDDPEVSATIQKALAAPDKPLAMAVMSYGNAKSDEVHTWMNVGEAKSKAIVQVCLSHASGAWYPTLIQSGVGEKSSDWCVPWRQFGREGWSVADDAARVERYSQLIADVRHMVFDTKSGTRVSVHNLVRSLVKYATRKSGDKSLVPTINMLLVEIILSRGELASVECVNAGVIEYVIHRVLPCFNEDGSHDKLDVLDKAYIKSFLKLLTVDNFAVYAEAMRRGSAEAALRVVRASWNGEATCFDASTRDMAFELAEHMALTDLVTVQITAKSDDVVSTFTAIRSSLTCVSPITASTSSKVYIVDIEAPLGRDGLIEIPKRSRTCESASPAMTPAQKILQAYDEILEVADSPDKNADKDWTMIEPSENKQMKEVVAAEPILETPQPSQKQSPEDRETAPEEIFDGIVVLYPKDNDWNTHVAMVRQAPRIVWRARERGARAVFFVWPKRLPTCVPVQPLQSSPNFDNSTNIPSFVMDHESLSRLLLISEDIEFKIDIPSGGFVGAAEALASRIGKKLMEACADRPPAIRECGTPPIAGRFRGRFKPCEAQSLLCNEETTIPSTPVASTSEGFAVSLMRKMTFTQGDQKKEESSNDDASEERKDVKEEQNMHSLRNLSQKVAAPPMDENSYLDAWRSANLDGGVSHWTRAMRLVNALGDHGHGMLRSAYGMCQNDTRPVRVLSLDGGGMRGIGTLVMLERILKETNNWCVGDCFDLVVGTSTGGLIAAGAGLLRMTVDELHELYAKMGDEIFPRKADSYMTQLYNQVSVTKFYNRGREEARSFETMLRKALKDEGEKPLYSITSHPRWYSSRSPPPHVCLVSHLVSRSPATTFLMRSYKHDARGESHLGHLPGEHRVSLVDSVRATTAAPWFLEELRTKKQIGGGGGFSRDDKTGNARQGDSSGQASPKPSDGKQSTEDEHHHDIGTMPTNVEAEMRLIDGAIASNNPTAVAVFEARRLFPKSRPLCVVSLGTGAAVPNSRDAAASSFPCWLDNTIHASCDVNQVDATIRHLLGGDDAYYRFQPTADIFGCELNDTSETTASALKRAAAAYMDSVAAQVREVAERLQRDDKPDVDVACDSPAPSSSSSNH